MGTICKVGETKRIKGKLYRKVSEVDEVCSGCTFAPTKGPERCPSEDGRSMINQVNASLEDGGCECRGTIWKRVGVPTKHVWTKIPHPEITIRTTKRKILERLGEILDKANDLGTENAKLKNQIASLKKKGSK